MKESTGAQLLISFQLGFLLFYSTYRYRQVYYVARSPLLAAPRRKRKGEQQRLGVSLFKYSYLNIMNNR